MIHPRKKIAFESVLFMFYFALPGPIGISYSVFLLAIKMYRLAAIIIFVGFLRQILISLPYIYAIIPLITQVNSLSNQRICYDISTINNELIDNQLFQNIIGYTNSSEETLSFLVGFELYILGILIILIIIITIYQWKYVKRKIYPRIRNELGHPE